ncbi:hypothetical protein [Desulfovibrio sp. Huiquan2017]|uniref:hypothetical protein n=1 Tax=Desulfovibrio sp. Huiquan2017 TaxID=2816861 RepID=UPI001A939473|nr:hypothetical protein [Desulfovibrio sp. Huiquan2017]
MKKVILVCAMMVMMSSLAFAGQAQTGDITIDSNVGEINTMATGDDSSATANIHSVEVTNGKTGDITIKGKAKNVTTSATKGGIATTNIGSVKVGD